MDVEFDPEKDEANIAKHGVSLAEAANLDVVTFVPDNRFEEPRFRIYGRLYGEVYCLAFTLSGLRVRAISLRRSRAKEYRRYGL
jgi:uncharacterized DUF497 family protein